jgi:CRP-like cAMP-binding protein
VTETRENHGQNVEAQLRKIPLFQDLPEDAFQYLVPATSLFSFRVGDDLVHEGAPWDRLLVLETGRAQVLRVRGGLWKQVVAEVGPFQPLTLIPVLDQGPSPATVRAAADGSALVVEGDVIRRLAAATPGLAFRLLQSLAGRVRGLVELAGELSLMTLEERLVQFVIRHAPLLDEPEGAGEADWHFTHEEVANLLGGCREEVTRLLSKLKRKGFIETGRRMVKIVDYDGLRRLAPRNSASDA